MLSLDFLNNEYEDTKTPAEKVEEAILIDIIDGTMPKGSRIIEQKLCDKYNMSRTPIREIINKIAGTNLIELIPNRGAFVNGVTRQDIDDYLSLRALLYPECVKWAIERITDDEYAILEETFAFMEFYTATGDMEKMHRINHGFDAIIYNASHNTTLEKTLLMYDFIIKYANANVLYPTNYLSTVLEEYRGIFNAFTIRNSELGFEMAKAHADMSKIRRK